MNKSKEIVHWGIIGAGHIAKQFAEDIRYCEYATLSAVASRDICKAQSFAAGQDIKIIHGTYEELLNDKAVDAVYIATPHTCHLSQSQAALRAGKAVLCEKPMTVSAAESEQLLQTAIEEKQYLLEGMWTLFLPAIQQAKQWFDEGRIGSLKHFRADFAYPQTPYHPKKRQYAAELAGGCLLDMGIYPIAMLWNLVGRYPKSMQALAKYAPNGVEDDLTMLWDFGDYVASLASSFRCRLGNSCYIVGDQGYIKIPDFFRASEAELYELDLRVEHFKAEHKAGGFEYEIDAASRDILDGRLESSVVPHTSSLAFQKLMDRVKAKI